MGNLVDVIGSRPKNRSGFPMSLVGGHLHVVLAMVSNEEDGPDSGFEPRSLRRMIEELCHEVCATLCVRGGYFILGLVGSDGRKCDRDRGDLLCGNV